MASIDSSSLADQGHAYFVSWPEQLANHLQPRLVDYQYVECGALYLSSLHTLLLQLLGPRKISHRQHELP